jgi:integrase
MPRSKTTLGRPRKAPAGITAIGLATAVEQFVALVIAELQCEPGDSTPSSKRVVLRNLVELLGADFPTWQLSEADLRDVMVRIKEGASPEEAAERRETGRRPRTGRRAPGAIRQAATTLRQFTELCHERNWLPDSIKVSKPIIKTRKGVQREEDLHPRVYFPAEEWPTLLDIAGEIHARVRIAVATGLYCGRRASEVVGLRWSDIDWDNQTVRFFNKKAGRSGAIPLFQDFAAELITWQQWAESVYGPVQPGWYLVPNRVANPRGVNALASVRRDPRSWPVTMDEKARTETLFKDIRNVMTRVGVDPRFGNGSHAYRRSAAQFIGDTLGLEAAQQLMDHKLRATTELYYVKNTAGMESLRTLVARPAMPDNVIPIRHRAATQQVDESLESL